MTPVGHKEGRKQRQGQQRILGWQEPEPEYSRDRAARLPEAPPRCRPHLRSRQGRRLLQRKSAAFCMPARTMLLCDSPRHTCQWDATAATRTPQMQKQQGVGGGLSCPLPAWKADEASSSQGHS